MSEQGDPISREEWVSLGEEAGTNENIAPTAELVRKEMVERLDPRFLQSFVADEGIETAGTSYKLVDSLDGLEGPNRDSL